MSVQNPDYDSSDEDGERVRLLSISESTSTHRRGSSWYASVFLVVNAALGAGLLNFPQAYNSAGGLATAIIIQAVFLVFVFCAILILAYCSDIQKTDTYQDVVLTVCGRNAQRASACFLTCYCFGTCITFLIIIGDQWEEFFLFVDHDFYCNTSPWYMDRITTIVVTSFLLILPMCFPKRIDFLKYVSAAGVVCILYVVVLVTVKYFTPHEQPDDIKTSPDHWLDVFLVVPTICFAYQCHVSIIPIYSCMEKRNLKEFSKTASVAIFLCVVTYTGVAAFGYLTFGVKITSDILLSYEPDTWVLIAVILIALKTYTTYPILLFCGRAAFVTLWIDVLRLSPEQVEGGERRRRIMMTSVWFVATLALAVFIPNIGVVIQILGAFAAAFIFIFPGMCLLAANMKEVKQLGMWKARHKFLVSFSCAFLVVGAFIFGLTLAQSIMQDTSSNGIKPDKSKFTCPS